MARVKALVVILWRAGLRINEALTLAETDLEPRRGAILVRHGLCRIRHSPCYAVTLVMPRRPAGDRVGAGQQRVRALIDSA